VGAGFEFFEESNVFDRDDRLIGEGLEQGELAVSERARV
jgi:hypothetical protein